MSFLGAAASWYLVCCFLVAGLTKARDFGEFRQSIAAIAPRFTNGAALAAVAIITAELATASLMIGSVADRSIMLREASAAASLGLSAIFAIAIATVLRSGLDVSCNCFGHDEGGISSGSLIGPLMIAIAAAISFATPSWPRTASIWISSGAAGVYLLLVHRVALLLLRPSSVRS